MGNVINLHASPIDLNSDTGHQFVADCTRAAEGLLTDQELQQKYELSPVDWRNIEKDKALIRAIQAERTRRVNNGTAARELAAKAFVRAPVVLAEIMDNGSASPRHRIEAAKEIRQVAAGNSGSDGPSTGEKFIISINLGADHVERYEFDVPPDKSRQLDRELEGKSDGDE